MALSYNPYPYSQTKSFPFVDRLEDRLAGVVLLRERWPDQWFHGVMASSLDVVIEFSFAGWDQHEGTLCLLKTPLTYVALYQGARNLLEFSLGHTPIMPSLDVAQRFLLPLVNALDGYKAKPCDPSVFRDTSINAR